jgi:hypothetical protein
MFSAHRALGDFDCEFSVLRLLRESEHDCGDPEKICSVPI